MVRRHELGGVRYGMVAQDVDGPHFHSVATAENALQFRSWTRLVAKGVRDEEKRVVAQGGDEAVEFGDGESRNGAIQQPGPEGHDMIPLCQFDFDSGVEFQLWIGGLQDVEAILVPVDAVFREEQGVQSPGNGDFARDLRTDERTAGVLACMEMAINTHRDVAGPKAEITDMTNGVLEEADKRPGRRNADAARGDDTQ